MPSSYTIVLDLYSNWFCNITNKIGPGGLRAPYVAWLLFFTKIHILRPFIPDLFVYIMSGRNIFVNWRGTYRDDQSLMKILQNDSEQQMLIVIYENSDREPPSLVRKVFKLQFYKKTKIFLNPIPQV